MNRKMKITIVAAGLLAGISLCAQGDDKLTLPEVLIIGDSISMGGRTYEAATNSRFTFCEY
ncbi:MAG: hypothetical protein ACI9TH_001863 [Kiritimatiellia bacterium]|jgi:hypothetical protein